MKKKLPNFISIPLGIIGGFVTGQITKYIAVFFLGFIVLFFMGDPRSSEMKVWDLKLESNLQLVDSLGDLVFFIVWVIVGRKIYKTINKREK